MKEVEDIKQIRDELKKIGDERKAFSIKKYLKSPYEFYGIKVPVLRKIAKNYKNLSIYDAYNLFDELWNSGNHEEMSLGIFILEQYVQFYNQDTWKFLMGKVPNAKTWDHIDILFTGMMGKIISENSVLISDIKNLSKSKNHWERRASIVSTYRLIKRGNLELTFRLAEELVYDSNVYVQKAAGWMLREAGKKERIRTRDFILTHLNMKPTAFSYATEKMLELRAFKKSKKKEAKNKEDSIQEEDVSL